jgi:hypothetical protein
MSLPATLADWISLKGEIHPPRLLWTALETFFEENGYILFEGGVSTFPKDTEAVVRVPDDYHHWIPEAKWGQFLVVSNAGESGLSGVGLSVHDPARADKLVGFSLRTVHVAARSHEGKDVIIRLIAKAGDGMDHLEILRKLSSPSLSADPTNHALPLLGELAKDDMIFAVFPLVDNCSFRRPWFQALAEVFEALEQVLEVGCRCSFFSTSGVWGVDCVGPILSRVWHFFTAISSHIELRSFVFADLSLTDRARAHRILDWERSFSTMVGTAEGSTVMEHRTLPLFDLYSPYATTSTTLSCQSCSTRSQLHRRDSFRVFPPLVTVEALKITARTSLLKHSLMCRTALSRWTSSSSGCPARRSSASARLYH